MKPLQFLKFLIIIGYINYWLPALLFKSLTYDNDPDLMNLQAMPFLPNMVIIGMHLLVVIVLILWRYSNFQYTRHNLIYKGFAICNGVLNFMLLYYMHSFSGVPSSNWIIFSYLLIEIYISWVAFEDIEDTICV